MTKNLLTEKGLSGRKTMHHSCLRIKIIIFILFIVFVSQIFAQQNVRDLPANQHDSLKQQLNVLSEESYLTDNQLSILKEKLALQKKYDLILNLIIFLSLINIVAIYLYFNNKRRNWKFFNEIISK